MSINDFINKIKGKNNLNKLTIFYILILILVSIGSFGLGALFYANCLAIEDKDNDWATPKPIISSNEEAESMGDSSQKLYVASKNSKIYYSISCSGAKRIKEENKIWFGSREEAEGSGFSLATSCK